MHKKFWTVVGLLPLLEIEGYYEIGINEFMSITPALIYGDLDTGGGDDDGLYGVIRTTFKF